MKQVAIHRRNEAVGINSPGTFKTFVYPYKDFPVIVSHVHPRFVICNSGQKLGDLEKFDAFQKGDKELDDRLVKVSLLYYHWTHPENPCQVYIGLWPKPNSIWSRGKISFLVP